MKQVSFLLALISVILIKNVSSQIVEGNLQMIKISSSAIDGNLFGDDMQQDVAVYMPPTYETNTNKKYPVLYFLPGYYDKISTWTQTGAFQGFKLKLSMDRLINEGAIKEMIVVIPNSYNYLEGSFYSNSNVNGKWEDFYTTELVEHINNNYRVINTRNARGIAGHSMGGSGALDLSMKYPDIYCMGYGLCSGLFAENWVTESPLFSSEAQIKRYLELEKTLLSMTDADAHDYYMNKMKNIDWLERFMYAYGSAFAGDSALKAPYIDFPFYSENNELIIDSVKLERWEQGFGNLPEKIETYKENLLSLKSYVIDYGQNDFFKYIISGNIYYHNLLEAAGIPHAFIQNGGDHESKAKKQIETSILPLCSEILEFDTVNLNREAKIIACTINNQIGNTIINTENKIIEIEMSESASLSNLSPIIQTSIGVNIKPKSREAIDFSGGSVKYTLISESGDENETWEIKITQVVSGIKPVENGNIIIFPNPITDILNIAASSIHQIKKIEIFDASGKSTFSSENITESIDTTSFLAGIYTIRLHMKNGEFIYKKIIKQ